MTEKQFLEKINKKFSDEKFSIVYMGKNSSENSIIKCLSCGRKITVNTGELFRSRRKYICAKCHSLRKDTQVNRDKVLKLLNGKAYNIEFFMKKQSKNGNKGDCVRFVCLKCDYVNELWVSNILRNNQCNCQRCSGQRKDKDDIIYFQELNTLYPNKFTILTPYKNVKTDIKVRCNDCGFIRDVKPTALIKSGFCPKCGKMKSIGENFISKWLDEHHINYEAQKYFKNWDIGLHYFDFYLPELNLVIEYHGQQHYSFNPYFHRTIENFNYYLEKDKIKKETCLQHGINYISINSKNYCHLEKILSIITDSTTIPFGSRGKCLEIESFRKEEDIVWT